MRSRRSGQAGTVGSRGQKPVNPGPKTLSAKTGKADFPTNKNHRKPVTKVTRLPLAASYIYATKQTKDNCFSSSQKVNGPGRNQ